MVFIARKHPTELSVGTAYFSTEKRWLTRLNGPFLSVLKGPFRLGWHKVRNVTSWNNSREVTFLGALCNYANT